MADLRKYRVLAVLCGALAFPVAPAIAEDDGTGDDSESTAASDEDSDIALGELGTAQDDETIPNPRRASRRQPRPPAPRVVFDSSIRTALAHRFSNEFSAEIYGRGADGAVSDPITTRTSRVAVGIITNRSFGAVVWSNSVEFSQHHRDFFARPTFETTEVTTALARNIKLASSAWRVTPRVSLGYQWASEARYERLKVELMAPLTYKLRQGLDLVLTPRIDWQHYSDRAQRRDLTGYLAAGLKYDVAKGVSLAGSIGYETRSSSVARANFSRWKLAPQLNLRQEF